MDHFIDSFMWPGAILNIPTCFQQTKQEAIGVKQYTSMLFSSPKSETNGE